MDKSIKICFIDKLSTCFIKKDYKILKKHFEVHIIDVEKYKWKILRYIITLSRMMKKCDLIFSWFADRYATIEVFHSNLYKKKSIVIAGGYDVAYVPEIRYGAFTKLKEKNKKYLQIIGEMKN